MSTSQNRDIGVLHCVLDGGFWGMRGERFASRMPTHHDETVMNGKPGVPQRLKPCYVGAFYGTDESVPLSETEARWGFGRCGRNAGVLRLRAEALRSE
jgi:hypothetical protein